MATSPLVIAPFYGLPLLVEPGKVFLPRPATERLVAAALAHVGDRSLRIADVGTGAGAIAIALAVNAQFADVWATDVSDDAVRLAQLNAELHGVTDRVHVVKGDLLEPVEPPLHVVVANLPYLPDRLRDAAAYSDPSHALFAAEGGLAHYRRLLHQAEDRLTEDGRIVVQFHREVLDAGRDELHELLERLEETLATA